MGTLFRIVLYAESEAAGVAAASAAFVRIAEIEAVATDYDAASEARRLTETPDEWTRLSANLAIVVRAADAAWRASGGAFDASVGPLSRLWRRALRWGEWPDESAWNRALGSVGWADHVALREEEGRLFVLVDTVGMRLDFGGVAKGVALDEARFVLDSHGIRHALIDGGGDLAAVGPPPGEAGWKVAVRPFGDDADGPELRLLLTHGAIATSGDAYQSASLKGPVPEALAPSAASGAARFGHVLDPRTWQPLPGPRGAVMTAGSAAVADALATALMVLGDPKALGVLYEGLSEHEVSALESGIFFGSTETEPCVGEEFPHDGIRQLTPHSPSRKE